MAKQEQTKEIVTKKATPPPAVYQERKSVVDSSDIVVPRLLLAQGISAAVAEGNAKMGDIRNSLTGVVLGGPTQAVTFIPITLKKYWKRFEKVNGKNQYRGVEPYTAQNANRPLQEEMASQMNPQQKSMWEFDLTIDVYGFTEEDAQDPVALPTAISFSRTSYKAGQQVNTLLASVEAVEMPYYTYMMSVSCAKKQNDKGIFYTFSVQPKMENNKMKTTPKEYFAKIKRWSKILTDKTRNITVDESEEDASTGASASVDESRF